MKASVAVTTLIYLVICSTLCSAQIRDLTAVNVKAKVVKSASSHFYTINDNNSRFYAYRSDLITTLFTLLAKLTNQVSNAITISGEPGEIIGVVLSEPSVHTLNQYSNKSGTNVNSALNEPVMTTDPAIFTTKIDRTGESVVSLTSLSPTSNLGTSLGKNIYTIIINY